MLDYDHIYSCHQNYSENRTIRYGYTAAFILIILQVITGALSVMTHVNLIVALLHALCITILFGLIAYFILLMLRSIRSENTKLNKVLKDTLELL